MCPLPTTRAPLPRVCRFPAEETQNGGPPGTPGTTVEYIKNVIDVLNKKFHGGEDFSMFPDDGRVASFQ